MSRPVNYYASTVQGSNHVKPLYEQKEEVLYRNKKATIELVLDFVDTFDYLLKVSDSFYVPVMESEINKK